MFPRIENRKENPIPYGRWPLGNLLSIYKDKNFDP